MTVPSTMRAVRIHAFGGPEQLLVEEVPVPEPGPGEVLVEVHAASVNGADLELRRTGFDGYFQPPRTLGVDLAGVVVGVADDVDGLAAGDRVHGRRSSADRGTYSAFAAVDADDLVVVPEGVDHVVAAAVPVVGLAAWQSLVSVGRLARGERVLIHGAAGGVGRIAVQLGHYLGAYVIASDVAETHERLTELGANETCDFRTIDVVEAAGSVDLVLDTVGGPVTDASLAALGNGGRLVSLVATPDEHASGQRGVTATMLDSWMDRDHLRRIDELLVAGDLVVDVAEVLALEQAARAHQLAESGQPQGKLVLDLTR